MLDDQLDNEKEEADEEEDWTDTTWAIPAVHYNSNPPLGSFLKHPTTNIKQDMTVKESSPGDPSVVKRMLLNDNKAGMEGLDKQKINQIIHEASKGSRFYENERKKEEEMTRKIEEQKKKIELITEPQLKQGLEEANMLLEDFEQQRDLSRTIVHIDMDAFYAAVEMRDDPSLKKKPMAVGGNSMLSTSNYHARKFGVRAAMPGFIGKKLCPNLIIVPLNFDKYTEVSKQVKSLIAEYDPNFCPMSLDEAYLDVTEHLQVRKEMSDRERTYICRDNEFCDLADYCFCDLNDVVKHCGEHPIIIGGSRTVTVHEYFLENSREKELMNISENPQSRPLCPVCGRYFPPFSLVTFGISDEETIRELRTRIEQRTRLTASAGIAPNMMLSKVCSDKNKPNGQYKIPATRDAVMEFIKDLPTRKISGIGKVSEAMLNAVGVYSCTDLYDKRALLYHLYSPISFNYFMRICLGIGSTTVERDSERKSISTERTFQEINKPEELFKKCEELTDALVEDLKEEQLKGKTVSIKIKTVKFEVKTRAHSLPNYTNDREAILHTAMDLLKTEILACSPQPLCLRLMGIRMSNLLNVSACKDVKKQGTILGAFKKISDKSKTTESHPVTVLQSINEDIVERNNRQLAKDNADVDNEMTMSLDSVEEIDNRTKQQNISAFATYDGVHCGEININDKVKKQLKHRSDEDADNDRNEIPKKKKDQVNINTGCEKGEVCYVYHEDDCPTEKGVEFNSFEHRNINNKDTLDSQKEIMKLEKMICNKHPNKENHGDAFLNKDTVFLANGGPVIEQQGEQFSTKDTTGSVGGDLNVLTNADVILHASKENIGGRVNRSGLIRSNKKPTRKRRNSKQIKSVMYSCPICTKEIICDSLNDFNEHVDECLEGQSSGKCQDSTTTMSTEETEKGPVCLEIGKEITKVTDRVAAAETNCVLTMNKPLGDSLSVDESAKEQNMNAAKTNIESTSKDSESSKVLDTIHDAEQNQKLEKKTFSDSEAIQLLVPSNLKDLAVNSYPSANETHGLKNSSVGIPVTHCDYGDMPGALDINGDNSESSLGEIKLPITKEEATLLIDEHHIKNSESEASKIDTSNTKSICFKDEIIRNHEESAPPLPSIPDSLENGSRLLMFDDRIKSTLHGTKSKACTLNEKSTNVLESMDANTFRELTKDQTSKGDLPAAETKLKDYYSNDNNKSLKPRRNISCASKDTFVKNNEPQASCSWMPDRIDDEFIVDSERSTTESVDHGHSEVGLLVCPVCNVEQRSADLNDFNSHVDSCLSKGAISEILKEQRQTNGQTFKRDRDFMKTPGSVPPAKKRKTVLPNRSPSCKTILSFFKDSQ